MATCQYTTQNQCTTRNQDQGKQIRTRELKEATPWRDRAKDSSTGRAPDLLRSESLRMDEIVPAAGSALESKEPSSPLALGRFLPKSSAIAGGGSVLYAGGLQTEMGITSNRGSAALPEESLAFAAEVERGCKLGAL